MRTSHLSIVPPDNRGKLQKDVSGSLAHNCPKVGDLECLKKATRHGLSTRVAETIMPFAS